MEISVTFRKVYHQVKINKPASYVSIKYNGSAISFPSAGYVIEEIMHGTPITLVAEFDDAQYRMKEWTVTKSQGTLKPTNATLTTPVEENLVISVSVVERRATDVEVVMYVGQTYRNETIVNGTAGIKLKDGQDPFRWNGVTFSNSRIE